MLAWSRISPRRLTVLAALVLCAVVFPACAAGQFSPQDIPDPPIEREAKNIPNPPTVLGPTIDAVVEGVADDVLNILINTGISIEEVVSKIENLGLLGTAVDFLAVNMAIKDAVAAKTPEQENKAITALLAANFGFMGGAIATGLVLGSGVPALTAIALTTGAAIAISIAAHAAAQALVNASGTSSPAPAAPTSGLP